jgi:NADPH-dependent curcumin reductase CurA
MPSEINRQIVVAELPSGSLEERHFEHREAPIPKPGKGEVLTRTIHLSIDPANRAWMQGATYREAVKQGDVMHGGAVGQVVESNTPHLAPGDFVECMNGWQEYAVLPAAEVLRIEPRGSLSHHLSVYGVTGLTAYFGLLDVGEAKQGETVVVSAAAGAVGNVVGQIAKIKGCRVVGLAGTDAKRAWLTEDLGFDAAINYKTEDIFPTLKKHCPGGIDVYFDNVGGEILQTALFQMNLFGRIPCCGAVSQYDSAMPPAGPVGIPGLLVVKRLKMQGFIVIDFYGRRQQAIDEMAGWVADGRLKVREDFVDGLENAPNALIGLLHGDNTGKRIVRVGDEAAG